MLRTPVHAVPGLRSFADFHRRLVSGFASGTSTQHIFALRQRRKGAQKARNFYFFVGTGEWLCVPFKAKAAISVYGDDNMFISFRILVAIVTSIERVADVFLFWYVLSSRAALEDADSCRRLRI